MIHPGASRRILLGSALAAPFIRTAHAAPIEMRVSVDTAPTHARTIVIADFLKKLEAASQGEIATRLYDSGQLCADRDVIKALVVGQVDMAAPGTWIVASYVPDADLCQLPVFYGQPADVTHRVIDGVPGAMVKDQITRKLRLTILGHWLDLGLVNWYSARKPLNALDDLRGLKIRSGGGFGQAWRAEFFGGVPDITAWPDVPLAMSQGMFDALQSTHESCVSAKLWQTGLHFALIDHQCLAAYIPMIGGEFWSRLSPALRTLITDLWSANITAWRGAMAAAQDKAEAALKERNIRMITVAADEVSELRARMLVEQDRAAHEMKISPDTLSQVIEVTTASN
jgi:C4-dicarboxylate-binding protein DctP